MNKIKKYLLLKKKNNNKKVYTLLLLIKNFIFYKQYWNIKYIHFKIFLDNSNSTQYIRTQKALKLLSLTITLIFSF